MASWQEHQQAVEEEFGPENFVVVVRGLLDEAGGLLSSLDSSGWIDETSLECGKDMVFWTNFGGVSSYNQTNW